MTRCHDSSLRCGRQRDRDARAQGRFYKGLARIAASSRSSCAILPCCSRNCSWSFNCATRCASSFLDSRIKHCARSINIADSRRRRSGCAFILPTCSYYVRVLDAPPKPLQIRIYDRLAICDRDARARGRFKRVVSVTRQTKSRHVVKHDSSLLRSVDPGGCSAENRLLTQPALLDLSILNFGIIRRGCTDESW